MVCGLLFVIQIITNTSVHAQRLGLFCTSGNPGYAYPEVVSYFGFFEPGSPADDTLGGAEVWYLYFWLPVSSRELGVRMFSPAPRLTSPDKGDGVDKDYYRNTNDTGRFDACIVLQYSRANDFSPAANFKGDSLFWMNLGGNDDSFRQPLAGTAGRKEDPELRIVADSITPKSIPPGLYRVVITARNGRRPSGTFLLQVGSMNKSRSLKISRIPADVVSFPDN